MAANWQEVSDFSYIHHIASSSLFRSLTLLADMVMEKLQKIPRSVAIRYWHHAVLHLYGYLCFERL
jgi:hypothetical protein